MVFGTPALAATFVYVSNADDGEIGTYTLQPNGSLKPGQRIKAEKIVMPMAVSPDKRFLIAAVRSKPYQAYSYIIDPGSGELKFVGTGSLAESFPYISLDRSGRFLFGASYGANLVSVNPVGADSRIGGPLQVVPTARNAHSIRIDNSTRIPRMTHCVEQLSRRFRYRCQCLISSDRGNSWHTRRVNRNRMLFGSISTAA